MGRTPPPPNPNEPDPSVEAPPFVMLPKGFEATPRSDWLWFVAFLVCLYLAGVFR